MDQFMSKYMKSQVDEWMKSAMSICGTLVEVIRGAAKDGGQVDDQRVGGQSEGLVLAAEREREGHCLAASHQTRQRHGARDATAGHLSAVDQMTKDDDDMS